MAPRTRSMDAEAGDIRSRTWALILRHSHGCLECARFVRTTHIADACDTGWELAKALYSLDNAQQALKTELEAPDPRLAPLF